MNNRTMLAIGVATLALNFLASPDASAANAGRSEIITAAGSCVPFSPTGQIRYAASSVRNAGASTFYLSCAQQGNWTGAGTGTIIASVYAQNTGSEEVTINCTLRPGYAGGAGTTTSGGTYPKSITLAGGAGNYMLWDAGVVIGEGGRFANPNFTCAMPPGAAINFLFTTYDEDVGA